MAWTWVEVLEMVKGGDLLDTFLKVEPMGFANKLYVGHERK